MQSYKIALRIMAIVLILSILAILPVITPQKNKDNKTVVTTFYPVYVATLNITDGAKNITVKNLVSSQTGCLHDYQLSPENLITLSTADIWVLNGAGAESFLKEVKERYPSIPTIDSSEGLSLMESDEDNPEEPYNSHCWTSPVLYKQQVLNICYGLCSFDPENADLYQKNTRQYLIAVENAYKELKRSVTHLPTKNVVLFHESLEYLAQDLDLHVLSTLPVGEDEGLSAHDLKITADAIKESQNVLLLYDKQYKDLDYEYLSNSAVWSQSLHLDIAVSKNTKTSDKDAWLYAMKENTKLLSEVTS